MEKELIKAIKNISTGLDRIEKVLIKQLKDINKNLQNQDAVEEELIYSQEDAIDFIVNRLYEADRLLTREQIMEVLELEEGYMRKVGIIKE